MKKSLYLTAALLMAGTSMLTSCREDLEDVDNQVYVEGFTAVNTLYLDGTFDSATRDLSCRLANPADGKYEIVYGVEPELVTVYNSVYGAEATLLPADFYEITKPIATVEAGKVLSSKAEVTFKQLDLLPMGPTYVLPVSVVSSPVEVLREYRTVYYVLREASLINVVGNTTGTCLTFKNEGQCPMLGGLSQMTFECLIYPDNFNKQISTLMGVEGNDLLLRIGDAGVPSNQLQVANPNVSDAAWQFETRKWSFLTMTWDGSNGNVTVYINGVKKGNTQTGGKRGTVNWNRASADRACYIGYSYDTNRDFQGYMSQVRVWNRILTAEEINAKNHFYTVDTEAEGLVFYAKFDEGAGNTVHDYANSYDMQVPETYPGKTQKPGDLKWVPVTLP